MIVNICTLRHVQCEAGFIAKAKQKNATCLPLAGPTYQPRGGGSERARLARRLVDYSIQPHMRLPTHRTILFHILYCNQQKNVSIEVLLLWDGRSRGAPVLNVDRAGTLTVVNCTLAGIQKKKYHDGELLAGMRQSLQLLMPLYGQQFVCRHTLFTTLR